MASITLANEGETKTSSSNVGLNAGGPQPQTKAELKEWIAEYDGGIINHGEPNTWDVTLVTDFDLLFEDMENFNAPIDRWDTSKVTNMDYMFYYAESFNQPIALDTSQVTSMSAMFGEASAFNQPITMDTSKVTNMNGMFYNAISFNQPITMDMSKVTDMREMFKGASSFNQHFRVTMDMTKVTKMDNMFQGADAMTHPIPFLKEAAPAEEAPAEEAPVDEAPAEETPAEETPVEAAREEKEQATDLQSFVEESWYVFSENDKIKDFDYSYGNKKKPTVEEIFKYMKNPISRKDRSRIKEEKGIKRTEAVTFINRINRTIKSLGNIEGLSAKKIRDNIESLLVIMNNPPPPPMLSSDSEEEDEETQTANYRASIRRRVTSGVRAKESRVYFF